MLAVGAAPAVDSVENTSSPDSAQVDGHLFVCTDNNFTGICANVAFNVDECINFVSPFQDTISSFGPDSGFICITYTDNNCQGLTYTAVNPGFSSLPSGINDAISSFQCFHN
ncbi:hypothetical protein JR316_0011279 [Psilocybe cubensis]|uniref:Uncharacterized protein n=2 Tax=Psilocybe cubensis TaxID=181762 RepID=A0ACB8GJ14_PSICU|nr:hypothetical protein JR316_0011279 [Psilocybe cubensis]KAH9475720.1 hypothetical protein JR316_0011279 [Psilocybe cubensis]